MHVRIIDENNNDVKPHTVGEIVLRSKTVMVQYWHKPDETRDVMIDGWLHTGDMGYYDQKGYIYLVDRKKDVIITGGENIYPAEVEEILHRHPKIYDVAVIGIPDERLGEIPLAIIDHKSGETLTEAEVIVFCEQNLAKHIRPRRIVFDKVPRNPTGKIEKPKLRQKFADQ